MTLAASPSDKNRSDEYHVQGMKTGDKPDRGIKTRFEYGNGERRMEDGAVSKTAPDWFQIDGVQTVTKLVMQEPPQEEKEEETYGIPEKAPVAETNTAVNQRAPRRAKGQPLGRFGFVKEEQIKIEDKNADVVEDMPKVEAKASKEDVKVPKLKLTPPQRKSSAKALAALAMPKARTPLQNKTNQSHDFTSTPPVKPASRQAGSNKKREFFRKNAVPGRKGLVFQNMESNCINRQCLMNALAHDESKKPTTLHRRRIDVQSVDEESKGNRCVDMLENAVRNQALHRQVDA